jgi:DNA-binding IclR family transcriptional regulator
MSRRLRVLRIGSPYGQVICSGRFDGAEYSRSVGYERQTHPPHGSREAARHVKKSHLPSFANDCGYATRDEDSQRYSPGIRLLQLGNAVANQYDLIKVSRPIMRQLRDELRLAVVTSKVVDDQVSAVEHLLSPSTDAVWIFIGAHLDLHSSAQGKLVLAYGRPGLLDTMQADELVSHTAQTITSLRQLRKDIGRVRERGWAASLGERQQGVNSLAAPIINAHRELFATFAVVGLASELKKESLPKIAASLTRAAEQISSMLFDTSLRAQRLSGLYPVRV